MIFSELEATREHPFQGGTHKNEYFQQIMSKIDPVEIFHPVVIGFHGITEETGTNFNKGDTIWTETKRPRSDGTETNGTEANGTETNKIENNATEINAIVTNATIAHSTKASTTVTTTTKTSTTVTTTTEASTTTPKIWLPGEYPRHLNYTISMPFHPRFAAGFETSDTFPATKEFSTCFLPPVKDNEKLGDAVEGIEGRIYRGSN